MGYPIIDEHSSNGVLLHTTLAFWARASILICRFVEVVKINNFTPCSLARAPAKPLLDRPVFRAPRGITPL